MSSTFENDDIPQDLSSLEDPQGEAIEVAPGNFVYPDPLYHLKLDYSSESLYATHPTLAFEPGEYVLVPTRYGKDLALVMGKVRVPIGIRPDDVVTIERKADSADLARAEDFREREDKAFKVFREKVVQHRLDMKLIATHYLLDEPKILFFFSAENRVDFRDLVKDLVAIFKMRIELRQIGVRDESRITGGLGVCGRPYCCHSVTDKLKPVSIRMAKDQNLSLNSLKISGQCGRLLCCLAYEHDWYCEERKSLPNEGIRLFYDEANFRVTEVNPLTRMIRLLGEDGRVLEIPSSRMVRVEGKWKIQ
ncbi:MAG TPA: regulatory iron-sulfur-containing complex subunit RicT [Treponemataceae bacterium]|nr:regulatory iron-sulfur-containing complex subunit RicT [Treponemataceae bacterium]HPS43795.1 regulatory iron-sulfur-containing complex subunit RicT [Treponemataceae bacterium]